LIQEIKMDTKKMAAVTIFAAVTITLNLSPVKIPAPYAPFLIYQIWEIPIVAAFLIYGTLVGVIVSIINSLVLLAVFPGSLASGPFYNLAAVLGMLLGLIIAKKLAGGNPGEHRESFTTILSTTLGTISRVGIMTVIDWIFLRFPPPIGFSIPEEAIVYVWLPLIAIFNATLALYTIPSGYFLARVVKKGIKIPS
jgi:riboflavin transporter FmnP